MSAPDCFDHVLRRDRVAERLRHLAPVLVQDEAVGQHRVDRARARACRSFRAARNGTSRDAGRSLRDRRYRRRRPSCADAGKAREVRGPPARRRASSRSRTRRRGCRRPSPTRLGREALPRKRSLRAVREPGVGALRLEGLDDARVDRARRCRISTEPSRFSRTKTAIGTPQARWREITQSGRFSIMPGMRFSPGGGTKCVSPIAGERAGAQRVARAPAMSRSMCDEPLRRVAEDHRLLRAPGMRILVLQPAARDQHAGLGQRLDHRLVGVALLALVGDDALAGEARRVVGEGAVLVDRVGDRGVDAARLELARDRGPDVEVLAAVAGRGVHEAGAGIVGDVLAGEQRHVEVVAAEPGLCSGCARPSVARSSAGTSRTLLERRRRAPARITSAASVSASDQRSPAFAQLPAGAAVTS